MDTTLLLARHAETDWNLERRWQGHADPPLNATGRVQAQALAAVLAEKPIEAVFSSDLARARQTAEPTAESLRLPVMLDPRLREVDVGEWSGLTTAEVERRFPDGAARRRDGDLGWTAGETYEAMAARVVEALLAIAARHPGACVLVVSHGGPVLAVRRASGCQLAEWPQVGNCQFDELAVRGGRMRWLDSTCGGLHEQVQG